MTSEIEERDLYLRKSRRNLILAAGVLFLLTAAAGPLTGHPVLLVSLAPCLFCFLYAGGFSAAPRIRVRREYIERRRFPMAAWTRIPFEEMRRVEEGNQDRVVLYQQRGDESLRHVFRLNVLEDLAGSELMRDIRAHATEFSMPGGATKVRTKDAPVMCRTCLVRVPATPENTCPKCGGKFEEPPPSS